MTVVDFIDVIDDIVDLSSDEETVQHDDVPTQPQMTLLDRQDVFVQADEGRQDAQAALETVQQDHVIIQPQVMLLDRQAVFVQADEGRQDAQAAFISAVEGSQEAIGSGNALVATTLPSVIEEASPDTAAKLKNCPSSPTSAPLPSPASTTSKTLPSEVGDSQPVATISPSVMEKTPLDTTESKDCHSSPASAPLSGPTSTTPKALAFEVADTKLVATASPLVMEKVPLDTAELKNCPSSPVSAPLHSPTSTTPKAPGSEVGGVKQVRAKYRKKNYHTSTPRRSPRLLECCNNPVEELAADHKRPRMLEPAEESAAPADNAESTKTLSTDSAN